MVETTRRSAPQDRLQTQTSDWSKPKFWQSLEALDPVVEQHGDASFIHVDVSDHITACGIGAHLVDDIRNTLRTRRRLQGLNEKFIGDVENCTFTVNRFEDAGNTDKLSYGLAVIYPVLRGRGNFTQKFVQYNIDLLLKGDSRLDIVSVNPDQAQVPHVLQRKLLSRVPTGS